MTLINIVLFFALGALLSALGHPFYTWQFWAVMGVCVGVQINSTVFGSRR